MFPVTIFIVGVVVLFSFKRGAVFVPTDKVTVMTMVEILRVKPGDRAVDLGSGDGRIVIALAHAGAEAHGYEHNPFLVWWSRYKIRKAGLYGQAFISSSEERVGMYPFTQRPSEDEL